MTMFADKPRWKHTEADGKIKGCPVRFAHHNGGSYIMDEEGWYDRLAEIEFEKRGLSYGLDEASAKWVGGVKVVDDIYRFSQSAETEEEIQLRLERIEPVTRKQARKEGWKG